MPDRETLRADALTAIDDIDRRYRAGLIDDRAWYDDVPGTVAAVYLADEDSYWQSGWSGDAAGWRRARRLVVEAIDRDGTFLDIGCANGLLMESVATWAAERGLAIEPYGLDIVPALVARAAERLPHWAERLWVGNAIDWQPPRHFDVVRTGLEYVPPAARPSLILHLLTDAVAPGGRLLVGPYRDSDDTETRTAVAAAGLVPNGAAATADGDIVRRLLWIDAPDSGKAH